MRSVKESYRIREVTVTFGERLPYEYGFIWGPNSELAGVCLFRNNETAAPCPERHANGFLLSMLSPVWLVALSEERFGCGHLGAAALSRSSSRLELEPDDEAAFDALVELGCGAAVDVANGLEGLVDLGRVADKYGLEGVLAAVEEHALARLTLETCGELLMASGAAGMRRVEERSRAMALDAFEAFSRTDGFLRLGEAELGSMLAEDELRVGGEEAVLEALARWMAAPRGSGPASVRGEGLLRHVRFPLMSGEYLAGRAAEAAPGSAALRGLVAAALEARAGPPVPGAAGAGPGPGPGLGERALVRRGEYLAAWLDEAGGGARTLVRAAEPVFCAAAAGGRVVCGLLSGGVQVWDGTTLAEVGRMAGHTRMVVAMAGWGRWVVSGSADLGIRAWDAETGRCEAILDGHGRGVSGLAVCGARLLSGSDDGTVRVWSLEGQPTDWRCERVLHLRRERAVCVAAWGRTAVAGGGGGEVLVWDAETGAALWRLAGHRRRVLAVAVGGARVVSSSEDGTVRAWSLESGACIGVVEARWAGPAGPELIRCLAVAGAQAVGGTEWGRVCVWRLEPLTLVRSVAIAGRPAVRSLCMVGGSLWGCVGQEVMVWGDGRRDG